MAAEPPRAAVPVAQAKGAGKKKGSAGAEQPASQKAKFRETMWFKKGELDMAAAEEAAAKGDAEAAGRADMMPIEERYHDDGSITRSDAEKYSLRTGATQSLPAISEEALGRDEVSERELVGEMKGGRSVILLAILIGLAAIAGIVFLIAR